MPITLDGTNGITTPMYNGSIAANAVTPSVNMKNRIINGAMVIDQRNNGAAITTTGSFPVDRFIMYKDTASGTLTAQRSSVAPVGFVNSLSFTVTSAFSPSSSEGNSFAQVIEGFNVADLNWGSANAKTVTLSFWVRSSITGAFGGGIRNSDGSRSYPFQYTISAANTWEQKSVTVPGDTTGTWVTDNGRGIMLFFSLGTGASLTGTANAWASANLINSTGSTTFTSNAGATFYITGVQLEVGSSATSFDTRSYGIEMILCQRYYEKGWFWAEGATSGGLQNVRSFQFSVQKRAAPTLSNGNVSGANNNIASFNIEVGYAEYDPTYPQSGSLTAAGFRWVSTGSGLVNATLRQWWVASSEF